MTEATENPKSIKSMFNLLDDLDITRGEKDTREIKVRIEERGDNDTYLGQIWLQAEFPKVDLDTWNDKYMGKSFTEIVRDGCICVWDVPRKSGGRTTKEQYTPEMLEFILTKRANWTYALYKAFMAVRDDAKESELYKDLKIKN
jgi:hypothetical protein